MFVDAEFRLEIDIHDYANPAHRLESESCCSCFLGCPFNHCDRICDNFFVLNVYSGECHAPGCTLWGTLEYYYGLDDSTISGPPVIIFGERDCPEEVYISPSWCAYVHAWRLPQ